MGADNFEIAVAATGIRGPRSVAEAFAAARENAQYENGRGGYTGTIAEKHSYAVINRTPGGNGKLPTLSEASALARDMIDEDDIAVADKYGPAGALPYRKKGGRKVAGWLFFGWASS